MKQTLDDNKLLSDNRPVRGLVGVSPETEIDGRNAGGPSHPQPWTDGSHCACSPPAVGVVLLRHGFVCIVLRKKK